ncbi:structural maintenance of chromosomes protein 4 [Microplitis demolitor]|uniref:structural maintenance of chromosomes protein 4 n=1 Tax=Microplitis demolitor TaxID=69319 RepID=UPI0004CD2754|nr:structural maintenance of chromosomes protein 4 [Microplitis demolitor]
MSKRNREDLGDDSENDDDDQDSDEERGIRIDDDIYIPPPPHRFSQNSGNEPRIIITKIKNINFKSYAGEVILGPFDTNFSSIVGPNGSGKSNVIDAMLFVFGYRATKIRSKSVGVLVHNSPEHPHIENCMVSIYFSKIIDRPDGYEIVPNTEFVISRRGFVDNSSYYELDGRKVQFKVIERVLRNEGIDLDHSRFLILQGEVEQIALMKPKAANENDTGMLEFLDSIIGTDRFKIPLEKLADKLEDLSERFTERERRMRLVEEERNSLRTPMQEAVNYLERENVIIKLKNKFYQCKSYEIKIAMRESEESNREIEAEYDQLKGDMGEVKGKLNELTQEFKEKSKKWLNVEQKKESADARYQELSKRDETLHVQLVEQNKRRKDNKVAIEKEQAKLEELERVPEKNAKDIEECEELIKKQEVIREREDREYKEMMEKIHKKTEPLIKEREGFESQLIGFTADLNKARAAFGLAETELEIYLSTEKKERETLDKITEELRTVSEKIQQLKQQLQAFEKKIPATEKSLKQAQDELEAVKAREVEFNGKLRELRALHNEQSSAMSSNKSRTKLMGALMEEKNSGRIPGILGRLGDLGAIDAKYDVAISTACGPLDNIIVDTVATAETCIQFLRDNNIGRATFIPLEKQQRWVPHCNQKINTPENVSRLFDLIRVTDDRVRPAFYYALRDTLVADDLDQATRIAYGQKRYRVVTLKGELIELTGTMSGGGSRPLSGRMGQRVRTSEVTAADLERVTKKLDDVYNECNRLRAQQAPLEDQIRTLSAGLQEMISNRDTFGNQVKALEGREPLLKKQLKLQEKKVQESIVDPKRVDELTQVRDDRRDEFDNLQERSQKIQDKIDKINDKINDIGSDKIKAKQKSINEIVKGIDKAKSEITRLKVATKAAENNAVKTRRKIETLEAEIKECIKNITDGQQERVDLEQEAKQLKEEQTACEEALAERDQVLGELTNEIKQLQAKETKMKSAKIDLDQKLATSRKQLAEFTAKVKDCESKLHGLKLNKIPEQEQEDLVELTDDELASLDAKTVAANLAAAKERLPAEMPNMQVIQDFFKIDQNFLKRSKEVEEIAELKNSMREHYNRIKRTRLEEFGAGFDELNTKLKEMYQMITLGGAAELEYADSLDPYNDGIVFSVRPPKKSWKNISNLSGGEKTLSSLALVFALHHYKPSPLYFMDEIDAALDFKNVSIIANYIKDRTKNAQFIVISLRSEMFELSNTLVGIYKTFNSTKTVTVTRKQLYLAHPDIEKMERERNERHQGSQNRNLAASQPVNHVNAHVNMPLTCPARLPTNEDNQKRRASEPGAPPEQGPGAEATGEILAGQVNGNSSDISENLELDYELGLKVRPEEVDDSLGLEESLTSNNSSRGSSPPSKKYCLDKSA